ncbi:hypothetical protein [Shinella sp. BYT-45]|uniref:hypothetical protein n=1 Tax=Shinella sp. BYT-45 TaxID=3377377 RepID=UPI00397EB844
MFAIDKEILAEMRKGSDRACAIVGHAHIEEECKAALRALLRNDATAFNEATEWNFLQSHAARVNLLYLIEAIDKPARDDLKLLTGVRNEFAHNSQVTKFSSPSVAKHLSKIKLLNVTTNVRNLFSGAKEVSLRRQFEYCVGNAVAILRQCAPRVAGE